MKPLIPVPGSTTAPVTPIRSNNESLNNVVENRNFLGELFNNLDAMSQPPINVLNQHTHKKMMNKLHSQKLKPK